MSDILSDTIDDLVTLGEFLKELANFEPKQDKKLSALIKLLKTDKVLSTQKCLIFTEFKDTARYLEQQLKEAGIEGVMEIDSDESSDSRGDIITSFAPYYNDSSSSELAKKGITERRILISTDVLSEGLNLQDATRLINYDLHWNPVRLMQRIGRIDRRLDPDVEQCIINDHPELEQIRGKIQYYNFLPPEELNELLDIYKKVTHKTLRISKTFGIENGKLLRPDDDYDILKDFISQCEGAESVSENLSLEYQRLLAKSDEIGLGIAYEKGYWKSDNLVQFMDFMLSATLAHPIRSPWYSRFSKTCYLAWHFRNKNTLKQTQKNISQHYDLSNAMYEIFLDETMTYSCAIFDHICEDLKSAQLRKIDRILEKAHLSENHHLLEIGTGWGTLAIRAATLYGCRVTSITLSEEQQQLAQQRIAQAGLSDRITVLLCDYRNMTGQYDRIVSVEMLEAVGKAYYPTFFRSCDHLLKPDGILVLQTITIPDQRYKSYSKTTDWMRLFIFPGGLLPSLTALTDVLTEHTSFVIKHVESIGPHYALTLARWKERFLGNRKKIIEMGFPESFIRRWEYYFSYSQAGFAQHYIDDIQIILTRPRNQDLINDFNQNTIQSKQPKDTEK